MNSEYFYKGDHIKPPLAVTRIAQFLDPQLCHKIFFDHCYVTAIFECTTIP